MTWLVEYLSAKGIGSQCGRPSYGVHQPGTIEQKLSNAQQTDESIERYSEAYVETIA